MIEFIDWAVPTHIARVADLVNHLAPSAIGASEEVKLLSLETLCREAIASDDAETHDEIIAACDVLHSMIRAGESFDDAVASCRSLPDSDTPIPPGIHLLSGHVGKGQEFDWVVVLGLEVGHVPDYRNTMEPEISEELRILHVMLSRARYGLLLTSAQHTPTRYGPRRAEPSPWFELLSATATGHL